MICEILRKKLIETAQKAQKLGLVPLTFGNFSLRDKKSGLILITPSGINYDELLPSDIVVVNTAGDIIEGKRKPSIEKIMHCKIYEKRPDVYGIVHTHSTFATVWASAKNELPVIVAELAGLVGEKVKVAPYEPMGTQELADVVTGTISTDYAVLLANHGLLTVGPDLTTAFTNAVIVEEGAKIAYYAANLGQLKPLPADECLRLKEWVHKNYGQKI